MVATADSQRLKQQSPRPATALGCQKATWWTRSPWR